MGRGFSTAALTRAGSNTTEATTTSTTAVDLLSVSGLSIPAAAPIRIEYLGRKSSGAAAVAKCGLTINATVVGEAVVSASARGYSTSATDQAESGFAFIEIGPRIASYVCGAHGMQKSAVTASGAYALGSVLDDISGAAVFPTVAITDIVIRGISNSALVTLAVDELHIYVFGTP